MGHNLQCQKWKQSWKKSSKLYTNSKQSQMKYSVWFIAHKISIVLIQPQYGI